MMRHFSPACWLCLLSILGAAGCGGSSGPSPTITAQPMSLTVNAGQSATFTVAATAATSYQWQRNGSPIAGAIGASYTISPATSANNGDIYTVIASNSAGHTVSAAANLRVTGVSVIAGQIGGRGYVDGPITQARFWGPSSLALDSSGNLYVVDYNALREITPDGIVSTVVSSPPNCRHSNPGTFCSPVQVAIDSGGTVHLLDYFSQIWQFVNWSLTPYALPELDGPGGLRFRVPPMPPNLIAFDGHVLFVQIPVGVCSPMDSPTCRSYLYKIEGGVGTWINTDLIPAGIPSLTGLSFDAQQNGYLANAGAQVVRISPSGATSVLADALYCAYDSAEYPLQTWPKYPLQTADSAPFAETTNPIGITTVPSGLSYISDFNCNTVVEVTDSGVVSTIAGDASPGAIDGAGNSARFWGPAGIVGAPSGDLYVSDYLNGLIRKVTPSGTVTTYAGERPHAGYADGSGTAATFRYPTSIVADAAGNLYVSDAGNHVIRKIAPSGLVMTFAGTSGVSGEVDGLGTAAQFSGPGALSIDANGTLYVADGSFVVRTVTQAGLVSTLQPQVFHDNYIFVGYQILEVDGGFIYTMGNTSSGLLEKTPVNGGARMGTGTWCDLANMSALAVGPKHNLYVAGSSPCGPNAQNEPMEPLLLEIDSATGEVRSIPIPGVSGDIGGLAVTSDGTIYLSDTVNSVIRKITPGGVMTVVAGAEGLPIETVPGGLPARINSPGPLAILSTTPAVSLAVVDTVENSILRVDLP